MSRLLYYGTIEKIKDGLPAGTPFNECLISASKRRSIVYIFNSPYKNDNLFTINRNGKFVNREFIPVDYLMIVKVEKRFNE